MANSAIGGSWDDFKSEYFTPEEIRDTNRHTAVIGALIDAREAHVITPEQYTELCIRIDAALDALFEAEIDAEMAAEQAASEHDVPVHTRRREAQRNSEPVAYKDTTVPLAAVSA